VSNGEHTLTVRVLDSAGNAGNLETVTFTVNKPESFPTELVATTSGASIAIIGIGLLVYLKKRKHYPDTS
jgi:hypothetical protein